MHTSWPEFDVHVFGEGRETLCFGHGLLFDRTMFADLVKQLSPYFRCVTFDFPGHGKSPPPSNDGGYAVEALTDKLSELLDAEGITPCHFLGFSLGGFIALRMALDHPGLLRSLILVATSAGPEPALRVHEYRLLRWLAGLGVWGNALVTSLILARMLGGGFMSRRRDIVASARRRLLSNPYSMVRAASEAVLARRSCIEDLGRISVPVLCVAGAGDRIRPRHDLALIADRVPIGTLAVIPDAAHLIPMTHPTELSTVIRRFLNNLKV